ncbi:MAG: MFS transporter [Spirochaetaceae bacterium]|nr:MFS transporter [Myxococcales bacterium]MCB9726715.1 MFS transporter [Spirochaetaceae bacterium]HPG24749.1 MFS transporter [Myxococcota bacterium]
MHDDRAKSAITLLATLSFLAFGALLVLFGANAPELVATLGLDYDDLGLVGSMLSLGLGIGILAAGPLVDRVARRPVFVAACAVVLLAAATLGPGVTLRVLLVHTFAIGLGAGFYETVLNALVVESYGEYAPRRLVFVHAAATLAASATPLVFDALRSVSSLAWYDTFRLVGLIHGLLIAAALLVPMHGPARSERTARGDAASATHVDGRATSDERSPALRADLRHGRGTLAAICLATFAYVGVESALTLFVADHTIRDLGLDAARAARTISAFWGGLLLGRVVLGFAPRPAGAGTIAALAACAAALAVGFGLGAIASPELAMAACGLCLGGVFPVMIGLAGMAWPAATGTAVGLAGGLGSAGGFAIPWITGELARTTSLATALASLGGWLLLLAAAAGVTWHRLRERARD